MKIINLRIQFILIIIVSVLFSCNNEKESDIELLNSGVRDSKVYYMDYINAYNEGFIIPSKATDAIEYFDISFSVKNFEDQQLYYKIYYQNESYKFPEINEEKYNELASENFYGSWENVNIEFDSVNVEGKVEPIIKTKFRISGNPRNQDRYYGDYGRNTITTEQEIEEMSNHIKKDAEWYKTIKEKAKENNVNMEEQLKRDARWVLSKKPNNKWQRNPRVGTYSLLIVVTNNEGLSQIPCEIKNISKTKNNTFINPYYYYLHSEAKENKNIKTLLIKNFIQVKAKVPIENGIYVEYYHDRFADTSYFNKYVNNSDELYNKAAFKYFGTYQANSKSIMNIPLIADFHGKGYSKEDYKNNVEKYDSNRVEVFFTNSVYPGQTIGVDSANNAIWFMNPACKEGEFKKESVGIKTRHGFTYGKFTVKIKMAELLSKGNVWTGLTNAIWMINESGKEWNARRTCKKEGYMPFYGAGKGETRVPQISYSEIDFEILKAAESWPRLSYKDQKERKDPPSHEDKVMIACTNWDMACPDPDSFDVGLRHIPYNDKIFNIHRWDTYYNALTSKVPELDDELFGGEYYYFQLEWKPTEIIWRVGPSKDNLHVVGYMNDKVTSIPNNQMLVIITQEYHFSHWWPMAPFNQEDIPFPAKNLEGKLYSIEIE